VLLAGALLHARVGYFQDDLSGHARGSDDAYISYRYAQNLARGEGLVFNPGERVEGYSNLLYVLLLAPMARRAGADAIYPISVGLNLLFAAGAWALFRLVARRLETTRAAAASLLFGLCPVLWLWTASGMETPLFLLLQIAIWLLVDRAAQGEAVRSGGLAALVVLSVLARADGFIVPAIAVCYLLVVGRRREAFAAGVALGATLAALVGWRVWYYGYPLPNTYYAKVSGPVGERLLQGTLQLLSIALNGGLLPHLAALVLAAVAGVKRPPSPYPLPEGEGKKERERINRFEVVLGLAWLGYWIYVGGDVFAERMLLILFPIGVRLLLDPTLFPLPGRGVIAVVAGTALFQLIPLLVDTRFGYSVDRYDRWVLVGKHLAQERYSGRLLAVDAAGKVPFYSGLRTVDMLGLNDEHIAHLPAQYFEAGHNKHDADYVLSRRPDILADWIDPRLDLRFGLTREKYERAGYRLEALIFTRKQPGEARPLVEVGPETSAGDLDVLIRRGYRYALLSRQPPHPALSPTGERGGQVNYSDAPN
jgi:arabinofuranosyltransferase